MMSSSVLIYVTSEINVNIGGVINIGQIKDLTGQKFGRWKVLERAEDKIYNNNSTKSKEKYFGKEYAPQRHLFEEYNI